MVLPPILNEHVVAREATSLDGNTRTTRHDRYFAELAQILAALPPDLQSLAGLADRYGLDLDASSIPRLTAAHGLDVAPR